MLFRSDEDAACDGSYRRYEDKNYNFITEYDLVCDNMKSSIIASVFQFGYIVASLTLSNLSDRIGRRVIFIIEHIGIILSMAIMMIFSSYAMCIICTFCCGFFCFLPICYTYAFDWNHSRHVAIYSTYVGIIYAVGEILVVAVMWFGSSWRIACGVVSG